jgi:hypothetical protein
MADRPDVTASRLSQIPRNSGRGSMANRALLKINREMNPVILLICNNPDPDPYFINAIFWTCCPKDVFIITR